MNRGVASLVFMVLAFALPAAAEDINGWHEAKWGMTPDEVQKALSYPTFEADLAKLCGEKCEEGAALELDDYELNGQHFQVRFWFTKSDKRLQAVSMYAKQLDKDNGNAAFTKMKIFLEKVYGAARSVGLTRGEFNISWVLQSTIIKLFSNATDYITIIYEERTDKEGGGS